jgi:UDP-N-acetylmuramate--alanine ligase
VQGHDARAVEGARAVIVSAAIPADHAEVTRAHQLGIPVIPRKRALAELVAGGRTVGIAGTHGKTTTTVMTTEALAAAGLEPTGLAGGRVASWGGNARVGGDRLYVVEADEYDQAFLELHPAVAVVNNVEPEHLECYGNSAEAMEDAFVAFAGRAETALVGSEDAGSQRVASRLKNRVWRYGSRGEDFAMETVMVSAAESRAVVRLPGGRRANLTLRVPGFHNLWNATAALGVVVALEADVDAALGALARFTGVGRRFERRGEAAGVTVVDDYAHHPTEVAVTLAAGRQAFPKRRLVAVFQPHLYSRTAAQHAAMGRALASADLAFVTEIYAAREAPIAGVSGAQVASAAGAAAVFEADRDRLLDRVAEAVRPGDVVFTLGAGDITAFGPMLLARLEVR